MSDLQMQRRVQAIEDLLQALVYGWRLDKYPEHEHTLDVFESDNGEPDWVYPLAASLNIPSLGVEDAYGLCDAGSGTILGQAEFLMTQIWEEAKPQIERFNK